MRPALLLVLMTACGEPENDKDDTGHSCGPGTHWDGEYCVPDEETDTDTDSDADSDTDSDSDSDADTDADSDSDADADADTDADTDPSYTVCDDGVAPYTAIQDAVDAATDGDTVTICEGTYTENVVLGSAAVSLVGSDGADVTIVDGGHAGTVLSVTNGQTSATEITGLTLMRGVTSSQGGGLYISNSSPHVHDIVLTDNEAQQGGGLYIEESDSTVEDLTIEYNSASSIGGGVYLRGGGPTLVHLVVRSNSGGGVKTIASGGIVANSLILDNDGGQDGFALYVAGGVVAINNVISGNSATSSSWAVYSESGATTSGNIVYQNDAWGLIGWSGAEYNLSYDNSVTNWGMDGYSGRMGENDLEADPRFVDAASGDYTLDSFSPCVDAGNPASAYNDVDGSRNDLGVYGGPYGAW